MERNKATVWVMVFAIFFIVSSADAQIKDGDFDLESAKTSWSGHWVDLNGCIRKEEPRFDSTTSVSQPNSARFSFRYIGSSCPPSSQNGSLFQTLEKPVKAKGIKLNIRISRGESDWLEAKGTLIVKINDEEVRSFSYSEYKEGEPWSSEEIMFSEKKDINKITFTFSVLSTQPDGSELIFFIDNVSLIKAGLITNPPEGTLNQTAYDLIVDNTEIDTYDYVLVDKNGQTVDSKEGVAATEHIRLTLPSDGSIDGLLKLTVTGKKGGNVVGDPTVIEWTLDTTPPTAEISGVPTPNTSKINVTATIGGEGVTAYKYKFDSDAYSSEIEISQPTITKNCFSSGEHTLTVIGKDAVGNWQTEDKASKVTWTINAAPKAVIESGVPTSSTYDTYVSIKISGSDITTYRYKLDSGAWGSNVISVGQKIELSNLTPGSHTIYVIGRDCGGNWQLESSATQRTWIVLEVITGDIDNSKKVDLADLILSLKILAGLKPADPFLPATVSNKTGTTPKRVELKDVIYILQFILEKRT